MMARVVCVSVTCLPLPRVVAGETECPCLQSGASAIEAADTLVDRKGCLPEKSREPRFRRGKA